MPARSSKPKRPTDVNRLAAAMVQAAAEGEPEDTRVPAAVALGRKGGAARAANLTADQRRVIAQKAAAARWGGRDS